MNHHKQRRAYDYTERDKTRLVVLVGLDTMQDLEHHADENDTTISSVVRKALSRYLARKSRKA